MQDRLSRLLAACERLARDEAAALARRNIASLKRAQEVKAALLADLAAEAANITLTAEVRARLAQLLKATKENSIYLANLKAATGERLRKLRISSNRLHTLQAAYNQGGMPGEQAFCDHG
jgi:hypothetical protein